MKRYPPHLNVAARFAVLTLLRMRSQSRLTWDRVDLKRARAWVPGDQMKGAKTLGFPLSPEAVRVLRETRLLSPRGERVFQYDGKPVENFNTKAFKKAAERAGVPGLRCGARPPPHWRLLGGSARRDASGGDGTGRLEVLPHGAALRPSLTGKLGVCGS